MKTTKRHFKLFCDEVTRHCNRLGLQEWRLDFVHEDSGSAYATLNPEYLDRCVTICLHTEWDETITPLSDGAIMATALHEAIELLVIDLWVLALAKWVTRDEIETARHTLVRRLEKLL